MINLGIKNLENNEFCQINPDGISYIIVKDKNINDLNNYALQNWRVNSVLSYDRDKITALLEKKTDYLTCPFWTLKGETSTGKTFILSKVWSYGDVAITGLNIFLVFWVVFLGIYLIIKRKNFL
jgi:hypothetical protein